ncbi:MAG TPA: hypothetical protein VD913_01370, partial [bacterium]|nr:hypothetical protein [bacterium]
ELAAKLRHLMRNERITADRLNGYVHIHFLDDDDEKLSYIVEFNQKIEPDWHIFIVLNLPKQMDPAVLEARLADQNKLGVAFPELTPHVGDSIRTENFSAYFEEYATGEKLSSLMKKREFDEEKLKQTVQGLMQMYQALGYLSTDLRPKNILLVNQGKENQHVLFTDLQPLSVSRPHQILEKMNRYYGGQKLSGKGLFRKSKQENPRDIIFAEILSTLGAKDGRRFLQRALKKLNDDLSEMKDPALGKEPDDRLLNLTKDLNFFLNRPQALQ